MKLQRGYKGSSGKISSFRQTDLFDFRKSHDLKDEMHNSGSGSNRDIF
ncbi:MAG: hypothetical protein IPI04_09020 [Ignavibacteria bacterium]|nr:hypothetical protein [Ignavibacteria bacterium]